MRNLAVGADGRCRSLKAHGPVWHQSDRQAQRVLKNCATWIRKPLGEERLARLGLGYSLHLSCNRAGFPKLAQVETANLDESVVFEQKKEALFQFDPEAIVGDNGYFRAMRVRRWATEGVVLPSPAAAWKNGKYAQAYHRFLQQERYYTWLKCRKTAIEPIFDLLSKLLGTLNNHKQLPLQSLQTFNLSVLGCTRLTNHYDHEQCLISANRIDFVFSPLP